MFVVMDSSFLFNLKLGSLLLRSVILCNVLLYILVDLRRVGDEARDIYST